MAGRCFRPQACVLGVLVEGANVHCFQRARCLRVGNGFCTRSQSSNFNAAYTNRIRSYTSSAINQTLRQRDGPIASYRERPLNEDLAKATSVLRSDHVPEEEKVQEALQLCSALADIVDTPGMSHTAAIAPPENSAISGLLSLDEASRQPTKAPQWRFASPSTSIRQKNIDLISGAAYTIMTDPKVFITPALLSTYVDIQLTLHRPESLPRVFQLYAIKPIPQQRTSPVVYKAPKPNRPSCAIPSTVAQKALDAAIGKKHLALCLDVINTTVGTKAFRHNKVVRKALLPAAGLALAPAAAYALASQLALAQNGMDIQHATQMFTAGIVAYVGFTAAIGVVAVTTANDQMDRITWAKGTSLRDRWLREDERAMVDRVAGAWGFEETSMRGEEESDDWETLREWARQKDFILDNPELMEGME